MELKWIPFYTELAKALLSCKNDRKPLVDWIYSDISQVGESSLVEYLHMREGSKITDIDPFSVFAIFNRPLRPANRVAMLQMFKERFSLKSDVPTDFNGIPTVNSQRAFFFSWDDNGERIKDLWEIFENVISGKNISTLFDKVIADGVPKYSLTMVLYWIAPYDYLNLDGRNRLFLKKYGFPEQYSNLTYAEYSKLMKDVKSKMADKSIPSDSFPDFSLAAYSFSSDSKVWMYKRFEDALAIDYIRMGSDAKGKLDFSSFKSKKALGDAYRKVVGNTDVAVPNMYWQLIKDVKPGDIVVVFDSQKGKGSKVHHLLYGWGRVTSDVIFDKNDDNPIHRMVEWHKPLPQEPVKEDMTGNTLYFHQVKGVEADNIMNLLGINKEEEITMDKEGLDAYVQLLRTNKNLILTGAPGTGKTYLAKNIAKHILKIEDDEELQKNKRFGFVQFHPSYDYTDFVEGLRPVKNSQDVIAFKRQDGVFKAFCKQAILTETADAETLSDINDNPTVWKVSLGGTFDNPTRTDCLDNGYIRIGWHEYGDVEDFNDYTDFQYGGKNVLRAFQSGMQIGDLVVSCYSAKEVDAIGVVTGEYEYHAEGGEYPRYRGVRWLVKGIKENILELNKNKTFTLSTVYKANITAESALKIVQKYSHANLIAPRKDTAVFIIDEINRGEISKIFGELFFSIDPGYRGTAGRVKTQYQNLIEEGDAFKDGFYVPENVYIIGTMNDIDRSVESMDFAMRRRFTWKEVTAKDSMKMLDGTPYEYEAKKRMENLNNAILGIRGLGEAYQIGAAYFIKIKEYNGDFQKLWDYHLKGLLHEYLRGNMNAKEQLDELKKAYDNEVPIDEASI